tara:strand:- start:636 stop:1613 length:978 start_codon:yes stop_codon:yes gene_type:complete
MLNIRKYRSGDEEGFHKLDRELEEHPYNRRSISNYIWKFKGKNPFGKSVSYFSTNKKKIIAHFGAIPLGWYIKNKYVLSGCSIAMMIKPEWQNKGLIKFVGDKVFQDLKMKKVKLVYGYPNLRAHDLHIKFWNYENLIKQYTYILKTKSTYTPSKFNAVEIKKFDKNYDIFWKKNKKNYKAILDRNSKFLNWRYFNRPDKKYYCFKIIDSKQSNLGYFVLKIYKYKNVKKIHIVDLFIKKLKTNDLISICQTILNVIHKKKLNQSEISFWLNGDKNLVNAFKFFGFKKNSYRWMILKGIDEKYFKAYKAELKNPYFTMGDTLEIY